MEIVGPSDDVCPLCRAHIDKRRANNGRSDGVLLRDIVFFFFNRRFWYVFRAQAIDATTGGA